MPRKCDTAKYKKRKERERLNSIGRKERVAKERAAYYASIRQEQAKRASDRKAKQPLYQRMGNILTKHICDMDGRYTSALELRTLFKAMSLFGAPHPVFPTLPPLDESTLVTDGRDIQGSFVE